MKELGSDGRWRKLKTYPNIKRYKAPPPTSKEQPMNKLDNDIRIPATGATPPDRFAPDPALAELDELIEDEIAADWRWTEHDRTNTLIGPRIIYKQDLKAGTLYMTFHLVPRELADDDD